MPKFLGVAPPRAPVPVLVSVSVPEPEAPPTPESEPEPEPEPESEPAAPALDRHWYLDTLETELGRWGRVTLDRIQGSAKSHPVSAPTPDEMHLYLSCAEDEFAGLLSMLGWQAAWVDERWWFWDGTVYLPDDTKAHGVFNAALRMVRAHWGIQVDAFYRIRVAEDLKHRLTSALVFGKDFDDEIALARKLFAAEVGRFAKQLLTNATMNAVHQLSRTRMTRALAEFDREPRWLVTDSGVLDLDQVAETGVVGVELDHDPRRLVAQRLGAGVRLDRGADAPQWRKFLEHALPDPDLRWWLQRAFGSALLGRPREKILINLIGPKDSGKSVVLEVLADIFDGYGMTAPMEALTDVGSTFDVDQFRGYRLVTASEKDEHARFASGAVKSLTGGDTQNTRSPHKRGSKWKVRCLLAIGTNDEIKFSTADVALLERIRAVPFENPVRGAEIDKTLKDRIVQEEGAGVLAWLLDGLEGYLREGLDELPVMVERREKMATEIETPLEFVVWCLEESGLLVMAPDEWPARGCIGVAELHLLYRKWCDGVGGHPRAVRGSKSFSAVVKRRYGYARAGGQSRFTKLVKSTQWDDRETWAVTGEAPIKMAAW
jgi:P4 family phage/plasmid primase-like protien